MTRFTGPQPGKDTLGTFVVIEDAECGVCGERGHNQLIRYNNKPNVSEYVRKARSFLLRRYRNEHNTTLVRTVGINCGCYAKVHRQIVHIEESR